MEHFVAAQVNRQHDSQQGIVAETNQWTAPSPCFLKINIDGAISEAKESAGAGVVVRDWNGRFVAGHSRRIP
ncbi:unnamed protein product, partial [Ilex paraguariensis]